MSHEVRPIGGFPQSEANPNPLLKDKSLEELQEMIEWPHKFEEAQAEAAIQPEPPPEPSEPPPSPEPTPDPEPQPEAAPEPEPVPSPAEEPKGKDLDAELLHAKMEALEAYNRKMEAKLSGREAGEKGYIKQLQAKIRELESRVVGNEESERMPQYEEPTREVARREGPVHEDGFKTWAVRNAISQAAAQFSQTHPDLSEVQPEIQKYLQESGYNPESVLLTQDPIAAEREVTRVLEEAYWHVNAARKQMRVQELETKRASQIRGLDEAKKKAAISGSGSVPPASPPRKSVGDLSLAELETRMKALNRR